MQTDYSGGGWFDSGTASQRVCGSPLMSPEEVNILRALGNDVLPLDICDPIIASICYGLSIPIICYALSIFWKEGFKTRARKFVFLTLTICFLIATTNLVLRSVAFAGYLQVPVSLTHQTVNDASINANKRFAKSYQAGEFLQNIALNISDAIIIWRAWVLYMNNAWVMSLPILLLSASVVTIWTFRLINNGWEAWILDKPAYYSLNLASNYLSLATNIVTVILYGWRLWQYRTEGPMKLVKSHTTTSVERCMILLLESGVAFCVVQALAFILDTLNAEGVLYTSSATLAAQCFHQILYSLSTIYPTLVFALVQSQKSLEDIYYLPSLVSRSTTDRSRTLVGSGDGSGDDAIELADLHRSTT